MGERREILGRLAPIYLSIEGGPGTAHEATVARARGAILIPIGRTGGYSQDSYHHLDCPRAEVGPEWAMLGDGNVSVGGVGVAVQRIVRFLAGKGI